MRRLRARAFGLALLHAVAVRAEVPPQPTALRVQVANCDPPFAARLPSVVKLEIDVLLRERGPTRSPPESIAVRCQEEAAVIEVTTERAARTSTIDLHGLASEHRARAVGLAAAELVHAMDSEPRVTDAPANTAPAPTLARSEPDRATGAAPPRSSLQKPAWLVGWLAEWRGRPAALLLGGRMALQFPLGAVVVPELSVDASFGGVSSSSAHVSIQSLSTAAHLYFGTTTGSVRWEIGPGARVGSIHLTGRPDAGAALQGESLTAAWAGPELRGRVAYGAERLRPLLVALELGAGIVALPVRGLLDGAEPVYAVEGPWMSIGAEVGLGF